MQRGLQSSQITLATGERTVAIGGNVTDPIIVTGDRNVILLYPRLDAETVRTIFALSRDSFEKNTPISQSSLLKQDIEKSDSIYEPSISPLLGPPFDEALLPQPEHFIGRNNDREWLLERLRTADLAVLRGLNGIGKTALAAVTIRQLHEEGYFNDGVAIVLCQELKDATEVIRRVLARFDAQRRMPETTNLVDLNEISRRLLKGKNTVVVLDGVEPGLSIEQMVTTLRQAGTKILITASHILPHVAAPVEASHVLTLLSLDEALDLFAVSMGRSRRDDITPSEHQSAERIIAALDRHTFAVKLAGAYAADLHRDLETLASELENPLRAIELPDGELSSAVALIFAKSTQALPLEVKRLFTAMAAFHSTELGRNAVVALARAFGLAKPEAGVDLLVRRALLDAFINTSMPEGSDRERLRLHRLLYALAASEFVQWSEEERDSSYANIAYYYASYISKTFVNETSSRALIYDENNSIVAIEWAYARLQGHLMVFLCTFMGRFWRDLGHTNYSLYYLPLSIIAAEGVAAATNAREDRLSIGHLKLVYGQVLQLIGRLEEAARFINESLALFLELGDREGESAALLSLGHIARIHGQLEKAEDFFKQALAIDSSLEDSEEQDGINLALGLLSLTRGQMKDAEKYSLKGLEMSRKRHDLHGEAVALNTLGQVAQHSGHKEKAESYFKNSLAICQDIQDRQGEGTNVGLLGQIAYELGRLEGAEHFFQEALTIHREIQDRQGEGIDIGYLGQIALDLNQLEEAEHYFREALAIHHKVQDRLNELKVLGKLGKIAMQSMTFENAEYYFRRGLALVEEVEDPESEASLSLMLGVLLINVHGNRKDGCPLLLRAVSIRHNLGLQGEEQARMIAMQLNCVEGVRFRRKTVK